MATSKKEQKGSRIEELLGELTSAAGKKDAEPSLRCISTKDQGRILVANRGIRAGELLFRDAPLVSVWFPKETEEGSCEPVIKQPKKKLPKRVAVHKSPAAWRLYAKVWGWLAEMSETGGPWSRRPDSTREAASIWGALHTLLAEEVPTGWPLPVCSERAQADALLLHAPRRAPSVATRKFCELLGLPVPPAKMEWIFDIWELNSFSHNVHDDVSNLHLVPALCNHSCLPTTNWFHESRDWCLHASVDMKAGDEITVSYLDDDQLVKNSAARRQDILDSGKGFVCGCARCIAVSDRTRGISCPHCPNGVIFLSDRSSSAGGSAMRPLCTICHKSLDAVAQTKALSAEAEVEELLPQVRDFIKSENDKEEQTEDEHEENNEGQLDKVRCMVERLRVLVSGHSLGVTTHWLAWDTHGVLREVAEDLGDAPEELRLYDLRAGFMRQAFRAGDSHHRERQRSGGNSRPGTNKSGSARRGVARRPRSMTSSFIPCAQHAWELYEAASLHCKIEKVFKVPTAGQSKTVASRLATLLEARQRLHESLKMLDSMFGPKDNTGRKAAELLRKVKKQEDALRKTERKKKFGKSVLAEAEKSQRFAGSKKRRAPQFATSTNGSNGSGATLAKGRKRARQLPRL